jgi:hypothetical protein
VANGSKYGKTQDGEAAMTAEISRPQPVQSDLSSGRDNLHQRPVKYLVLPNVENAFLLARVRWPDIYQAISPVRADWQDDPGLFDLPYSPGSTHISYEQACEIAAEWGTEIPSEEADQQQLAPTLIRRMPADWTSLSTAERRAWSIEIEKSARQELAAAAVKSIPIQPEGAPEAGAAAKRRQLWRRRRDVPATGNGLAKRPEPAVFGPAESTLVIDLTESAGAHAAPDFA